MAKRPNILLFDIETSPMAITAWSLWDEKLDYKNISRDWNILSIAWKYLGRRPHVLSVDPARPTKDYDLVKAFREELAHADVVVGHNSDDFDLRKVRARLAYHKLEPLPALQTVDTKKVARRLFAFSSNRLDYLGEHLGLGRKLPTNYGLWLSVLNGDKRALARMARYNVQDVRLLEKVYLRLRPYMPDHQNANLFVGAAGLCPVCASKNLTKWGYYRTRTAVRQRYHCDDCGAWPKGEQVARARVW